MKPKVIELIYKWYTEGKKHIIENETEEYFYMTDGFTGEEKRYHKINKTLEFKGTNENWYLYSDCKNIQQVNIY